MSKRWSTTVPKFSWRNWLKERSTSVPELEKPEIYSSRTYQYEGSHIEFMKNEFKALGWNKGATQSELQIMRSVQKIITSLITDWESAETAYHILDMCTRILKYQILSPLRGEDSEFSDPDERGNERNIRNPSVKRFFEEGSVQHWVFAAAVSIWPNGKRLVEPANFGGIPLYSYPCNPPSEHVVLRETMADKDIGAVVQAIYDGNFYHIKKKEKPKRGDIVFTHDKRESVAL